MESVLSRKEEEPLSRHMFEMEWVRRFLFYSWNFLVSVNIGVNGGVGWHCQCVSVCLDSYIIWKRTHFSTLSVKTVHSVHIMPIHFNGEKILKTFNILQSLKDTNTKIWGLTWIISMCMFATWNNCSVKKWSHFETRILMGLTNVANWCCLQWWFISIEIPFFSH